MERESKKRGRETASSESSKKGQRVAEERVLHNSDTGAAARPPGVFEFPWGASGFALASDGWDLRDVFFSSLVDGCSASIGFPGDRLSRSPAAGIDLSWPLDEDADGLDSVWRSLLGPSSPATSCDASSA